MSQGHHFIEKQTIKQRRSAMAIKRKQNLPMTAAENRLLDIPLTTILDDRRNQVRLANALHHRAHSGVTAYRPKREDLHAGIYDFAAEFALEGALDRKLALIDG